MGRRQQHFEVAALPWPTADQDLSAVGVGNGADERQTEPGTARMTAVTNTEPVEHVRQKLGGHTAATVGDRHPDGAVGRTAGGD